MPLRPAGLPPFFSKNYLLLLGCPQTLEEPLQFALLGALGLASLWWQPSTRGLATLYTLFLGGNAAYLVLIGGDIFPAERLLLPIIFVLCFIAVHAPSVFTVEKRRNLQSYTLVLSLLTVTVLVSRLGAHKARDERWEWQYKELGLYLKAHARPGTVLVTSAAGAVPFYSELDSIDPLGLCDRHISHHYSAAKGRGYLGHELGDGKYVLDRKPDIIFFGPGGAIAANAPGDREIIDDPRFREQFQERLIRFVEPHPWISKIYVREEIGSSALLP